MQLIRIAVVLAVSLMFCSPFVEAQQSRVWRIGWLSSASSSDGRGRLDAFTHRLRELGYVEGQNLVVEYRWAEGRNDRLTTLAAELVRLHVDVIVTQGTLATDMARRATTTTPIVFAVAGDPLGAELVSSLARPGANPSSVPELRETETTARALGMQVQPVGVRDARMLDDAFAAVVRGRAKAVVLLSDNMLFGQKKHIGNLVAEKRLPGIAWTREFAETDGLLMAYGPDVADMHRRTADYVDRILKGANPADLPVEQPTKFELVINLKTAKALKLTIPQSLLGRADEVIE